MKLNPHTLAGLRVPSEQPDPPPTGGEVYAWADKYKRYVCPECSEKHKDRRDAETCCTPDVAEVFVDERGNEYDTAVELAEAADMAGLPGVCPVCHQGHDDVYGAAHCCLWKDLDHPQRERIAAAVDQGATWIEAIEQVTGPIQ